MKRSREKIFEHIRNAYLEEISNITLNVPVGTGYAYRRHPYFAKFKEIVAKGMLRC